MKKTNKANGKRETQYLLGIPGMKEKLMEDSKTPIEECEDIGNIDWKEIEKEAKEQSNHK